MHIYEAVKKIYSCLQDEVSRFIFLKRLEYSVSGCGDAITEIVNKEIERYGSEDIVYRLTRWLAGYAGEVVIFGAGFAGRSVCSVLRERGVQVGCFADNDKKLWGAQRNGAVVIPPEEIEKGSRVVIGVNTSPDGIFRQLLALGIAEDHIFVPDRAWWIGNCPQYFDPGILRPCGNEIFVDGGSLDGGDSLKFMNWCKGKYQAVYAFEPDGENYQKLSRFAECYQKMQVFREGLWSGEKVLRFSSGQTANSRVSDSGDTVVPVTSLDSRLGGEPVTFIKMDIEGSETEALSGAVGIIREYKPKLAICVYHKPEDILDIPLKILELCPDYKLYLRHYSYVDTETVLYAV